MKPYPLSFKPILMERIWGGTRLRDILGKETSSNQIGESWELSGVEGHVSEVVNGPLKGRSLNEVLETDPEGWLGTEIVNTHGTEFPILIKYIDAAKDLSIQVHPDDKLARERHNSFGKNEMWYIMDAEEDARLILGFKEKIEVGAYLDHLENNTLTDILMSRKVSAGDAFFIHAGMIHAIGAGTLLAEIQQTSDVTYRLYDYNRKDADGNTRQLHTEQALKAIDFNAVQPHSMSYERTWNTSNELINTPYFNTRYNPLKGQMSLFNEKRRSFTILMGIKGNVTVSTSTGHSILKRGRTLLIPAIAENVILECSEGEVLDISL